MIFYFFNSILNALQQHRANRKKKASSSDELFQQQAESIEDVEWKVFWNEEGPRLLLYACLHGTVETVKYFVTNRVSPTSR